MLTKMTEEKSETTSTPAIVMVTSPAAAPSKRFSNRKLAIIVISVVVLVAVVLTAILVGMYLFTTAQKDIIKFSYNRNQNTKEDVMSDPNTNVVQYHASNPDYEMWIIDDFNKDIRVMKLSRDPGVSCYVTPLNRTIATDPSKVIPPSDPENLDKNKTYNLYYKAADTTIPDSSFLSKTARDECNGISTYWVFPICKDLGGQRQKRGCGFKAGCVWVICGFYLDC